MRSANEAQFKLTTPWDTVRHDWVTLSIANEYLKSQQPKLFYVALAETDDWGHERRYDRVLQAANYFDESLRTLWTTLQVVVATVAQERVSSASTVDRVLAAAAQE